jgi:hypothetical protein
MRNSKCAENSVTTVTSDGRAIGGRGDPRRMAPVRHVDGEVTLAFWTKVAGDRGGWLRFDRMSGEPTDDIAILSFGESLESFRGYIALRAN